MKIVSFDVGIKNMAYCILEVSGNCIDIRKWGIMDLVNSVSNEKKTCCFLQANGKTCSNMAKYTCGDKSYCNKHATKSNLLVFKKEFKKTHISKQPINDLQTTAHNLFLVSEKKPKGQLVELLTKHYEKTCLHPYKPKKTYCDDFDLITIGKELKKKGQTIFDDSINLVLIENQISPIANRMKTIQGMLAQYFIMDMNEIDIKFISSQNKLKYFYKAKQSNTTNTTNTTNIRHEYKDNKKNAILFSIEMLEKYHLDSWKQILDTSKKDDLADAFLQGIWYIENNIFSA